MAEPVDGVVIRPLDAADAPAVRELRARSSDSGKIGFTLRHLVSPEEAARAKPPDSVGVVALVSDQVIGEASVVFSRASAGAQDCSLAWLHSLAVDPRWRGRGVARALTAARLDEVAGRTDPHVVAAAIQVGNAASMANARRWSQRTLGRVRVTPVPRPRRQVALPDGLTLRRADPADLPAIAEGIRATARGLVLAPIPSHDELGTWLDVRVAGRLLRDYFVAVDEGGDIVAGLGIENEGLMLSLELTRMPRSVELANLVLRVVPKDRAMRNLNLRLPWFGDGHEDDARALWHRVRWELREHGTSVVRSIDAKGPLASVLPVAPWLPSTTLDIVVREPAGLTLPSLPIGAVV